jgi:antitoxin (DNA-binding transcriptional repressor) of toxin-antitoxin stability system
MAKHIIRVSGAQAANEVGSLLDEVKNGAEVVIEHNASPVAVVRTRGRALPEAPLRIDCTGRGSCQGVRLRTDHGLGIRQRSSGDH